MTYGPMGLGGGCPSCKRLASERDAAEAKVADLEEVITSLRNHRDSILSDRSGFFMKRDDLIPDPESREYHGWEGIILHSTHIDGFGCVDSMEFYWDSVNTDDNRNLVASFRASRGGTQGPAVFLRKQDLIRLAEFIEFKLAIELTHVTSERDAAEAKIAELESQMKRLDDVITELLEILEINGKDNTCDCTTCEAARLRYRRACEIAGREA